ncbi:FAD-binding oxidoreductase [Rapidithrix thailandica]|uniref:FAD-binding oxidoreductase n=1 Tax=Rapidithrix thailandica TaxID=413964 RepID=A0AAW9SEU6_9BACT
MLYDYIIVGQGIAGTTLAFTLLEQQKEVLVVDNRQEEASSMVAAGIFNPITGRRMVKTWLADQLFPYLEQFYQRLEKTLNTPIFHPTPMYFPFDSQEKQNDWLAASSDPKFDPYIKQFHANGLYDGAVKDPFGGMEVTQSGYVHTAHMLSSFAQWLDRQSRFVDAQLNPEELVIEKDYVQWKNYRAKKLIFCDGNESAENPLFHWLEYRCVKGELFWLRFPKHSFQHIINRNCFVLPYQKEIYKVGATYEFHDLNKEATEKGKMQLIEKLEALINAPYEIEKQVAGIRPATYDRRPFIGSHPKHPNLGILNGLGTKGVSLAPYFAWQLAEHMERQTPFHPEVNLLRGLKRKGLRVEDL